MVSLFQLSTNQEAEHQVHQQQQQIRVQLYRTAHTLLITRVLHDVTCYIISMWAAEQTLRA